MLFQRYQTEAASGIKCIHIALMPMFLLIA